MVPYHKRYRPLWGDKRSVGLLVALSKVDARATLLPGDGWAASDQPSKKRNNRSGLRDESAGDGCHAGLAVDVEDAHAVVTREPVAARLELRSALFQNLDFDTRYDFGGREISRKADVQQRESAYGV